MRERTNEDLTRQRLEVRFTVPDLWIAPALLGRKFVWDRDDAACRVEMCMPTDPDSFIPTDERETVRIPAIRRVTEQGKPAIGINVVLVNVRLSGPGSAEQKLAMQHDPSSFQSLIGPSWDRSMAVAEEETLHFIAWIRVLTRQPWLGLAEDRPWQYGRAHLFDEDAGVRLFSYGPKQEATLYAGDRSLSVEAADRLEANLIAHSEVPVADALLADAEYLDNTSETVDAHRAILAAAMACEIKVKKTLKASSREESSAIVELLLRRHSDIRTLASDVAEAVVGRSLRKDDPDLFKKLGKLAAARNKAVHEGSRVAPSDAFPLVAAARLLFEWLEKHPDVGAS